MSQAEKEELELEEIRKNQFKVQDTVYAQAQDVIEEPNAQHLLVCCAHQLVEGREIPFPSLNEHCEYGTVPVVNMFSFYLSGSLNTILKFYQSFMRTRVEDSDPDSEGS
jgi:hypothetical protein